MMSFYTQRMAMHSQRFFSATKAFASFAHTQSIPKTMHAAVLNGYGGAEKISVVELPLPSPKKTDVLIKVSAVSLNPIDSEMREGYGRSILWDPSKGPLVLGRDCVGTVVWKGRDVFSVKEGDLVACAVDPRQQGTLSEFVSVNESQVAPSPANLSNPEIASIPYACLTGYRALKDLAQVRPREKIFINGGSGAIGRYLIQVLKSKKYNCHVVASASQANHEELYALGADTALDYRDTNLAAKIGKVDHIIDTYGGIENEDSLMPSVNVGGTFVSLRGPLIRYMDANGVGLGFLRASSEIARRATKAALNHGVRLHYGLVEVRGSSLREILKDYEEGVAKAKVDPKSFSLNNIVQAFQYFESRQAKGKVVVQIDG